MSLGKTSNDIPASSSLISFIADWNVNPLQPENKPDYLKDSKPSSTEMSNEEQDHVASSNCPATSVAESGSFLTLESWKSLRVAIDDPCYIVIPMALKEHNLNKEWTQYSLHIIC